MLVLSFEDKESKPADFLTVRVSEAPCFALGTYRASYFSLSIFRNFIRIYFYIFWQKIRIKFRYIFHPFFGRLINQSILLQMSELKFDVCMQLVVDCSKENNTFQNFSTVQVITRTTHLRLRK